MDLHLKHERDADGVVHLWVDQPEKPVVVLDSWLLGQVDLFLDWVDAGETPTGFVLHSTSDRVFIAGADLGEIGGLDDAGLDRYLANGQRIFNRIENLPGPSVAAISGDALGGGLEICLACQYRIAVKPAKRVYQIGLPEAGLGILPGWGGTQRLAAIIKPSIAIGRTTTGRTLTPFSALRHGVIDAIVDTLNDLNTKALELIKANPNPDRPRNIQQRADEVKSALKWARSITTGPKRTLPAAKRVIDAIEIGLEKGLEAGLEAERKYLIELRATPESRGMLGAFFARGGTFKKVMKSLSEAPAPTDRVAIFGDSPLARYLTKRLGRKVEVISINADTSSCDASFFIEAAGGNRASQMAAMRAISAMANDEAVMATTSHVLSLEEIAASVTNPGRLVGFAPALPLGNPVCEIVRSAKTTDATVGAAATLCKVMGAVPILQNHGGPTLLTRLFGALALNAWDLARKTGDPGAIDRAAQAEGFTTGPLAVLDIIGVPNAAAMLDRADEFAGFQRVYADRAARQADSSFTIDTSTSEKDTATPSWVRALAEAGGSAITDGLVDDAETIWLVATLALGLGAWRRDLVDLVNNVTTTTRQTASAGASS